MEKIIVNNKEFNAIKIPTPNTSLLLIQGNKGMLACGYINVVTADKLNEATVIVTGVNNFEDMLKAKVFKISDAAKKLGITEKMNGEQALTYL